MKKLIIAAAVTGAAFGLTSFATAQQNQLNCPAGTYDAGGFCKSEPTGCPYGENIPVDSPKCVAPDPKVWEPYVPEPTPTPEPEVTSTPVTPEQPVQQPVTSCKGK